MATGLGAATADGIYGAIAAFGISAVSSRLVDEQDPIRLLGGIALIVIGWRMFNANPRAPAQSASAQGVGGAYASAVLLTLTNPATILYYVAVFAGLGLAEFGYDRIASGRAGDRRLHRLGGLVALPGRTRFALPAFSHTEPTGLDQPLLRFDSDGLRRVGDLFDTLTPLR